MALIARQPDLGTALLVVAAGACVIFLAVFFGCFHVKYNVGAIGAVQACLPGTVSKRLLCMGG